MRYLSHLRSWAAVVPPIRLSGTLAVAISCALASTVSSARAPELSSCSASSHSAPDRELLTAASLPDARRPSRLESCDSAGLDPIGHLWTALEDMQADHFQLWTGTWPSAIDWTAAVMNTHLVSALASLNRARNVTASPPDANITHPDARFENELNRYFSHSAAYYFGEDDFAIRNEAYDDMSWVVLGWLETIRTIRSHSQIHSPSAFDASASSPELWHAFQYIPAFAHRARVFYDLTTRGWDTKLCGGGMVWNPALEPYKNAITNELFISASVAMYLHFPGDNISSPFLTPSAGSERSIPTQPHHPAYRDAAVKAYAWLKDSNMTNDLGLYVDGFHVTGWSRHGGIGTGKCDNRNEMVYTYNQGVVLSGLHGLWEATGDSQYLDDGHQLVRSVINATGWSLTNGAASGSMRWSGLGRNGVLEDYCDSRGNCGQDPQTFKGIFFHHLKHFCQHLPEGSERSALARDLNAGFADQHIRRCQDYTPWVAHNVHAALASRDALGRFGMWWGAHGRSDYESEQIPLLPIGAIDYRNRDSRRADDQNGQPSRSHAALDILQLQGLPNGNSFRSRSRPQHPGDVNDRGRGRTVETQGGGVAVLNALVEFEKLG